MAGCSSSSPGRTIPSRVSCWAGRVWMRREVLARDLKGFAPGVIAVLDQTAFGFPLTNLSALPAGDYFAQALLDCNADLRLLCAGQSLQRAAEAPPRPRARRHMETGADAANPARAVACRHGANQVRQGPIQAPERVLWAPHLPSRGGRPAPRLRARTVAALPALGAHRRLEHPLHERPRPDGREVRVPQDLAGRRHAAPDPPPTGRRRPQRRPLLRQLRQQRPLRRRAGRRNSSPTSRPPSVPSANRARGSSPARPPAAGFAWRCRSSIPTSSTAPGPPAPTPWTSARSNSSTSTRTTTPT